MVASELTSPVPQVADEVGVTKVGTSDCFQHVVPLSAALQSVPTSQEQVQGCEMHDAHCSADTRKRGIKQDDVSKSCPPSLRAGFPAVKNVKKFV